MICKSCVHSNIALMVPKFWKCLRVDSVIAYRSHSLVSRFLNMQWQTLAKQYQSMFANLYTPFEAVLKKETTEETWLVTDRSIISRLITICSVPQLSFPGIMFSWHYFYYYWDLWKDIKGKLKITTDINKAPSVSKLAYGETKS